MSDRFAPSPIDAPRRRLLLGGLGLGLGFSLSLAGCGGRVSRRSSDTDGIWYQVETGDSLVSIARRSGSTISKICDANGLNSAQLTVGQRLWLPGGRALIVEQRAPIEVPQRQPSADRFQMVSRSQWQARPSTHNYDPMPAITRITLHHTGEIAGMTGRNDQDIVQRIQLFHQDHHRWADIGYHYLIGHQGQIYCGRPETIQGAHSGGPNNIQNLGISLIGEFSHRQPTQAQLHCLAGFLQSKQQQYSISSNRIYGHRDLGNTLCPGARLYDWLQNYKLGRV